MIPPDIAARAEELILHARRAGRSPAQVLDDAKLLVTPLRQEEIGESHLIDLLERFERRDAATFMRSRWGRAHGSPEDMYTSIHEWLTAYVRQVRFTPSPPRS